MKTKKGITIFDKVVDVFLLLTANFSAMEFACQCGKPHDHYISELLVARLQVLRDILGIPIKITSGYRCPDHNKAIGGAKASKHIDGIAADIQVKGISSELLALYAAKCGFSGIGIAKTFVHVDCRDQGDKITTWKY